MTAAASGSPTPTVQWQYSLNAGARWTNIAGATSTTSQLPALTRHGEPLGVRAVFTNSARHGRLERCDDDPCHSAGGDHPAEEPDLRLGGVDHLHRGGQRQPDAHRAVAVLAQRRGHVDQPGGGNLDHVDGRGLNGLENHWECGPSSPIGRLGYLQRGHDDPGTAPVVTTQPKSQTYASGVEVTFTAAASGSPTPTVQWQYSVNGGSTWTNLSGATSTTLTATGLNECFVSMAGRCGAMLPNSVSSATFQRSDDD